MSVLYFFIILLALVLVHEYGHFQSAKWFKMIIEEFAFGFPPRLKSIIHKGTKFSFNLLPIGGYVKIKGEDGETTGPGTFGSKSYFAQIVVLSAGVIMNILAAWLLFWGALSFGLPQATANNELGQVLVTDVSAGSVAEKASIMPGDIIKHISYENKDLDINDPNTVISAVRDGKELDFTVLRNDKELHINLTPENIEGINKIGIGLQSVQTGKVPVGKAFIQSAKVTAIYTTETFKGFIGLFKKLFTGVSVSDQVSGPIGIVKQVGSASHFGFAYLLSFAGLLSINLAILNLIPFPGLDGGRILFVLIEAVTRKKISQQKLGIVNVVGIIVLLALMVLITVKDIVHF